MTNIECKYSSSGAVLYTCGDKTVEFFVVPETVTRIAALAFANCDNLKQIIFPRNLKKIEDNAFKECSALEEIDLSSSKLKEIGKNVFCNCKYLKKVSLPDTLETISFQAFAGCTSLCEIRFPGKLKGIESFAFQGCSMLDSVNIPASVETIGNNAFEKCVSLQLFRARNCEGRRAAPNNGREELDPWGRDVAHGENGRPVDSVENCADKYVLGRFANCRYFLCY